ncbi:MAG TPA: MlaD family protein [Nitrospira sp.]|nr:MlaD family protein [Nitrospira sp.]
MEPKVNYVLVGSFVVLLGLGILGTIFWLGKTDYRGIYDRYYTFMRESVAGLNVNSTVRYRGVDVGRVKDIALRPENPEEVRLTLEIVRGTPIKTDTIAVLETQGLTGLATVNLTGGSRDAPPLEKAPGESYPVIKSGPSLFFRLDEAISRLLSEKGLPTLLSDLDQTARKANDFLDDDNRIRLTRILTDLSDIVHGLAEHGEQIDRGLTGAAQSADNLASVTKSLRDHLPPLLSRINTSAASLQAMTEDLSKASRTMGTVAEESKPALERFSTQTLPEVGLLVSELRQLTGTLQRISRDIEREPNQLVFGRTAGTRGPGE